MTTSEQSWALDRETEPLLNPQATYGTHPIEIPHTPLGATALNETGALEGESFDNVPRAKRQLGTASAIFLIFNRVIGTGVFATPSTILRSSGSVGVAFVMWMLGSLFALAGTAVYVELGTGLPRSGGEKTYLEYFYRRPQFLVSCVYGVFACCIGVVAANSVVFGEYIIHALDVTPTRLNTRFVGFVGITACFVAHSVFLKWGIRLQNALGAFKLLVIVAIIAFGLLSLLQVPGFTIRPGYDVPHNFDWHSFWDGSGTGANSFVMGMNNVIWSFVGYSNANYALSEVRDPVRTIRRAVPLAMLFVIFAYLLVNVAYFSVVSKADILGSGRVAAALFFRNLFGPDSEKMLSVVIAMSTFGNMLACLFTQGRVIQELGREGILPFSSFFSSNKPFNAPLPALLCQWAVSSTVMIATPPGDAYLFMLSLSSYPFAIWNILLSAGLLLIYTPIYKSFNWKPPFKAPRTAVIFFFVSNIFLAVVPLIPPLPGFEVYDLLPYWSHVAVASSISFVGFAYWVVRFMWIPRRRGYKLERETVLQDDGVSRHIFKKIPI